jgi:uncharacterized membrane protein
MGARAKRPLRALLAVAMITMGVLHFVAVDDFARVVPPYLPMPRLLVWISGVAEIAGGVGLLVERVRAAAGVGLVLLYLAVFPANIHMALHDVPLGGEVPARWIVWARLPFQALFIVWAWWCSRPDLPAPTATSGSRA